MRSKFWLGTILLAGLVAVGCSDDETTGGGGVGATGNAAGNGGSGHAGNTGNTGGSGDGGTGNGGGIGAGGSGASQPGGYPFEGYTDTRGGFEAITAESIEPRILIVDRLTADSDDGDDATGRGSLPWALAQDFPRVVLFEISGVIDVGAPLWIDSPYVSVHGQTAPSPGITLYHLELGIATHDVILQHLRVRMGEAELSGGDAMTICGAEGDTVHDIIIDHCSPGLGWDEQLSISSCGAGDVRRVTLSNNLVSFGANYEHNFGTLIDSSGSNDYDVDEIFVAGTLYSQLSFRTPMIGWAARHVTIANNVTYNAEWTGMHFATAQYPEGQYVDVLNTLYWRGGETETAGMWPTDEVDTWPAQPDLWAWDESRHPICDFAGPTGANLHAYFEANYDYVNGEDYTYGDHEGRPVEISFQRFHAGEVTADDVTEDARQTTVDFYRMTPAELEAHVQSSVGAMPGDRDALDALAVSDAFARTGSYLASVADLSVPPVPEGSNTRSLQDIGGYPTGTELDDSNGNGLTELEEWIYGL